MRSVISASPRRAATRRNSACSARATAIRRKAKVESVHVEPSIGSHGRACPGHPRLACWAAASTTWMPATRAGMTLERANGANRMDALTLFGLIAVTAMLVFYAFEERSPAFILAFAAACGL